MTQIDPRAPTGASAPSDDHRPTSQRQERGFNWRISVGMFVGLAVLFGVLFGLRALHIFPPEPGQDAQIAAARSTQAALGTQEASARRSTAVVSSAPAAAPTVAPTTSAAQPTAAVPPAPAQQTATGQQPASAATSAYQTGGTAAVATTLPVIGAPPVANPGPTTAATAQPNPADVQTEPTPVQAPVPSDLAAAIVQDYSNYWSLRVQAERDPTDTTIDLESVMAGNELIGARNTLSHYAEAGEAFETSVKHQIWITSATAEEAVIVDRYTATMSKLDPDTKSPTQASPTVENRTDTFVLHRLDGVWKVVDEP